MSGSAKKSAKTATRQKPAKKSTRTKPARKATKKTAAAAKNKTSTKKPSKAVPPNDAAKKDTTTAGATDAKSREKERTRKVLAAMSPDERQVFVHLIELLNALEETDARFPSSALQLKQFIGDQFGRDTDFYRALEKPLHKVAISTGEAHRVGLALYDAITSGRFKLRSIREKAAAAITGDILSQADALLAKKGFHQAAAVVLVGASLEEFLRTWCQRLNIMPTARNPGIEHYKGNLRKDCHITENEAKDITAWAGKRNSVAHGRFDEVGRDEARLMAEQVRAFMRKHE